MSSKNILNLNNIQNNDSKQMLADELLQKHPVPWERRGRAIFDANEIRVNLVDPATLTAVIDMAHKFINK